MKGNRVEFIMSVEPELYQILNNDRDVDISISKYCAGIIADAVGFKSQ
jgi:hypothetical protein